MKCSCTEQKLNRVLQSPDQRLSLEPLTRRSVLTWLSLVCVLHVRPPLCRLCFRRPCPAYQLCVSLQTDLVCWTATVTQLQPAQTANPIPQKHHTHLLGLDRIPRLFLLGPSRINLHRVYHKPVTGSVATAENTLDKMSDFWNLMILVMAKTIKTLGGRAQDPTLVINLWICSLDLLINANVLCVEKTYFGFFILRAKLTFAIIASNMTGCNQRLLRTFHWLSFVCKHQCDETAPVFGRLARCLSVCSAVHKTPTVPSSGMI